MLNLLKNKILFLFKSLYFRLLINIRGGAISPFAKLIIHPGSTFIIGKKLRIKHGSIISILPKGFLSIGDNCIIYHNSTIYVSNNIVIGDDCRVSHLCSLIDHDYVIKNGQIHYDEIKYGQIKLGNHNWIGTNSVILMNCIFENHVVIGASSIVKSKKIKKNMIYYDNKNLKD